MQAVKVTQKVYGKIVTQLYVDVTVDHFLQFYVLIKTLSETDAYLCF